MDTKKNGTIPTNRLGTAAVRGNAIVIVMERKNAKIARDHAKSAATKTKRTGIGSAVRSPVTGSDRGIGRTRSAVTSDPRRVEVSVHGIMIAIVIVTGIVNVVDDVRLIVRRSTTAAQGGTETSGVAVEAEIIGDVVPVRRDRSGVDALLRMVCATEMIPRVRSSALRIAMRELYSACSSRSEFVPVIWRNSSRASEKFAT